MIVAIERNKFTYLYKYSQIKMNINQLIDMSIEEMMSIIESDFHQILNLFNKTLPLFEQDHEVLLLDIDKSIIKINDGIILSFDSILCIYPLTKIAAQLLEGKINDDFIIKLPIFESVIESLKITRSMEFRRNCSEKLLANFNVQTVLDKETISNIELAVQKNLLDKNQSQVFTNFLDYLVSYNKTPSYIPDGNIEHISKIGAIAIKYIGKQEEVFTNGPFYKSSLKHKNEINSKSYLTSYQNFISINDNELRSSCDKMVEIISKDYHNIDIFKISYFYLAFKSYINQNDNNIEGLYNEIHELIKIDRDTAAFVISLIGYTFSIETIYEGLHRLSNAPLLKSTSTKKSIQLQQEGEVKITLENDNQSSVKIIDKTIVEDNLSNKILRSQSEKSTDKNEEPYIDKKNSVITIEKQSNIFEVESEEKLLDNNLPTIKDFREYISNEFAKSKQKNWLVMLDQLFPIDTDKISLESLMNKLDYIPDFKNKQLKARTDKEKLKVFFEKRI